jgi:integrase
MRVPDAIEAFKAEQQTLGLAASTLACQRGFVDKYGRACARVARERGKRSPLSVAEIDTLTIVRYFEMCAGGQGNRNNMLATLKKFFRYCEACRWLPPGETDRLLANRKSKQYERQPKHYVPAEQFGTLLDASTRHPADRVVVALALYTLARRSEIAALRLSDVDLPAGVLHLHRQKRQRWTDVAICPELMDELTDWLSWMAESTGYGTVARLMEAQPTWHVVPRVTPVLIRDAGGKFSGLQTFEIDPLSSPSHMERVVKRGLDLTGAVTPSGKRVRHLGEGMHTIRRSGARAMLKHLSEDLGNDRALLQVSTMLDHESTQMTLKYIGMNEEREQLNSWLKTNSMYGTAAPAAQGQVLTFRRSA